MTVKEIVKIVCDFVGERELKTALEGSEMSESDKNKVDLMVRCLNLVRQEIASDYLPYLTKESIDVKNSILNFSELSGKVINVYEVKNSIGMNLRFKLFPNHVQIFGHAKSIVYSVFPADLTLDNEVEFWGGLSARVLAYGVASEYLLWEGNDAEIWEERFKDSLFMLSRKRGEHVMPGRSWT